MAMAWIREIRNHHPNGSLRVRVNDNGRHPSLNGKTFQREEWMNIPPGSENNPSSISPQNMAAPWSYGGSQRMIVETVVDGVTRIVSFEIRGKSGWDYLVLRDAQLKEVREIEVGSLGDAPGVNHSWWALVLHSDGNLEWHLFERQGLPRAELLDIVNKAGSFIIEFVPKIIGVIAEGAAEGAIKAIKSA